MRISSIHKKTALLLCISILSGILMPAGLHAMDQDMCDSMTEMMHHDAQAKEDDCHQDDANMKSGLVCVCSVDEAPLTTEVPILSQNQVEVIDQPIQIDYYNSDDEITTTREQVQESFSPPPIYLFQQVFRN